MHSSTSPGPDGHGTSPRGERRTLGALLYREAMRTVPSEHTWVELLRSVATGDREALRSLYERTHRLVFTLLARATGHHATAEELTVDVFHDVWRRAASYDPEDGSVVGWVMGLALTRAIAATARGRRADLDVQASRLRAVIGELTADERAAIEAAFFDGRTCREAAQRSGEPVDRVEARLRSAFAKLRKSLEAGA